MFKPFAIRKLAVPMAAVMMVTSVPQAQAGRNIAWRDGPGTTVVIKQTRVVPVKYVHSRPWRSAGHHHYYGRHQRRYHGYGHYTTDNDAIVFLGLAAVTLAILNSATESQQRAHEQSMIEATRANRGETITWNDGPQSGSVTVLRTGTAPSGQPCREFSQAVTIGGRSETAYGIACRQPDGAWRIVD
ncbi:MAG: hypothetical protein RIF37_05040 [Rhodospirillaceae bacterium]